MHVQIGPTPHCPLPLPLHATPCTRALSPLQLLSCRIMLILTMHRIWNKANSPNSQRRLRAAAMFCATIAVLLPGGWATGLPAPLEPASYRPVDQGLATPEIFNRTRRSVRGKKGGVIRSRVHNHSSGVMVGGGAVHCARAGAAADLHPFDFCFWYFPVVAGAR